MTYVGSIQKYRPQYSRDFVWDELPMDEGYVEITVAISLDGFAQFCGLKPDGKTYLEVEVERLMAKVNNGNQDKV